MTIRDIAVAFGIEVDQKSVGAAENAIKGVKNMASKLLGAIGIGFSIAGIANLAEAAADAEALKSQFSQVFGDLEQDASDKLDKIADETGVTVNRMKGSFTQIAAFAKTTGMEQADLARATGIRPNTISELYHEYTDRVNLEHLDLICEALHCELDELIVRVPNDYAKITHTRSGSLISSDK